MAEIRFLLFDAANTLIHKPGLWEKMLDVLKKHNLEVEEQHLRRNHKLLSEVIKFPDRTSSEFYKNFNKELMYTLGILPTEPLLSDLFKSCSYLPWVAFEDSTDLMDIALPQGILSNFNTTLNTHVQNLFGAHFKTTIISEDLKCGKPDPVFYQQAIEMIGVPAENILYVGDSIKLDMQPATNLGMNAWLIDRDGFYPAYQKRIRSFADLSQYI